jgi:hypothetical protein
MRDLLKQDALRALEMLGREFGHGATALAFACFLHLVPRWPLRLEAHSEKQVLVLTFQHSRPLP